MGRIDINKLEEKLYHVQKPAQYLGGELNTVIKEDVTVRAAICYPDLYEVGMSNNGIKILYEKGNALESVACERVFAAASDFEAMLRANSMPLFTLETRTPLNELDLLGFNLAHELLFTNILQVLDLGGIPLLRRERGGSDPIVMAGGGAASNPFPMSDFIDVFYLGDGEEGFVEVLELLRDARGKNMSRSETVAAMADIEGVLLPNLYNFEYSGAGTVKVEGPAVKKRIFRGCGPSDPVRPPVSNIRIAQERAVVEISRGCFNLCKFCHAGYYDLPYRSYSFEDVARRVNTVLENTGYDELTLTSLSISDYRELTPLLNRLLPELTERGISVSLPSMKVDTDTIPVIECVSDVRKSSLTFAVESGDPRIRSLSNKKVREEDLLAILDHVLSRGWNTVKLYFMIGLPGCEEADEAGAIIDLLKKIITLGSRRKDIHVTVSPFVPKPHYALSEREADGY